MISDKTATVIIYVVTAVWACNMIAALAQINDYQPSESINGIFLTIVGGTLTLRARGDGSKK